MQDQAEPPFVLLRIPNSYELAALIDRVLGERQFLTAVSSGKPVPGPAPLSLEYSVLLKGPFRSRLVLRAQPALGALLTPAKVLASPADGEEAFKAFCHRVAAELLGRYFGGDRGNFEPFAPVLSVPEQWPSRMPDAESVLVVEGQLLEARLWIEPVRSYYVADTKYHVLELKD